MSEMRSLKDDQLLQTDRFLERQPTETFDDNERSPSLGCMRSDRGFSETASIIFSEDAPPSWTDVAPRVGSYTDEFNLLLDHNLSESKFSEIASSVIFSEDAPPSYTNVAPRVGSCTDDQNLSESKFSETGSVIFSEDAPPSQTDVARRAASCTDESNQLNQNLSELIKFKEAISTSLNADLSPDLGRQAVRDMNTIILQQRINISLAASYTPPPMKLPCADLLGNNNRSCVRLYQALNRGNWGTVEFILDNHPELVRNSITRNYGTPLHIAVSSSATYTKRGEEFVKQLVRLMKSDDLLLENENGETAFYVAVVAGYVQMVKIMVDKNKALLTSLDSHGNLPLSVAALSGRRDMVKYLYDTSRKMTGALWTHKNREYVLMQCLEANLFDIALQIVKDRPELATSGNALRILAQQPEAFKGERCITLTEIISSATQASSALQLLRVMCDHILKLKKNVIVDIIRGPPDYAISEVQNPKYPSHMLFIAVKKGNTTFVVELIRRYPDLIRMVNDKKQSLFHVAVSYRHKDICSLLYQIGPIKDSLITLEDENGNNMLHLVGERPKTGYPPDMSSEGMALTVLQQELLWFEEVEAILPPSFRQMKNNDGLTPRRLFMKTHIGLVSRVERCLKAVGTHLTVVAVLTCITAYASTHTASLTPPDGWKEFIFLHRTTLVIGSLISDAFSLISSLVLILVLTISIFSSSYDEFCFITTLPTKSLICLGTLFYALVNMMLTFYISLFMLDLYKSIGIVVGVFAYIFFAIFTSAYPIFVGMIQVVYHPRPIFYR